MSVDKNPPLTCCQKIAGLVILLLLAAFYTLSSPFEPVYPSMKIRDEYDYVIIGGGSAGSVMAHRLAEMANVSILVIEAGGYDYDHSIRIPVAEMSLLDPDKNLVWNYRTQPQKDAAQGFINNQMTLPMGKVLGGSSSVGDMIYGRGNAADFVSWGADWSWDSLMPYFLKSENAVDIDTSSNHNKEGVLPVSRSTEDCQLSSAFNSAAQSLGLKEVDYTSREQVGIAQTLFTMMAGERWSAARAFLEPAINRRYKVHVVTESVASKILFSGNRAVSVVYNQDGVSVAVRAKKEIILTGGAIETPKLLMLSGIGPRSELDKHKIPSIVDLPVGQGLRDPLKFWIRYRSNSKVSVTKDKVTSLNSFLKYYFTKTGEWAQSLQAQSTAFISTKGSSVPDVNINLLRTVAVANQAEILGVKYELEEQFNSELYDSNSEGFTFVPTLLHPLSSGNVALRSSNSHDPPLIDPAYLSNDEDVETILQSVRFVQKLVSSPTLSPLVSEPVVYPSNPHAIDTDQYWRHAIRQFAFTAGNPSGTCSIGKVVNEDLTVKGVEGLRVVDASVFPNTISSDNTGVIYAVAERVSDLIKAANVE